MSDTLPLARILLGWATQNPLLPQMLFLSDSPEPLHCSLAVRCWEFRAARSPLRGPTPTMMAPNKDCLPIFNKYHKYYFLSQDHQPIVSSCPTYHHAHTHFPPFPPGLPQWGHTSGSSARAPALCCLWGGRTWPPRAAMGLPRQASLSPQVGGCQPLCL